MSLIVAIVLLFLFLKIASYQKLRTLRKVKEGPGAYWSFREGQVVGEGGEQDSASVFQLGTCLSQCLGFGSQESGVLTVGSHIPVENVQEKCWKGSLGFNSSEE